MNPTPTFDDMKYRTFGALELSRQFCAITFLGIIESSYFQDLLICESRVSRIFSAHNYWYHSENSHSMDHIFGARDPFKILQSVIRLYSVLMIAFQSVHASFERFENKAMDLLWKLLSFLTEVDIFIARGSRSWFEQSRWFLNKRSHISIVADFIRTFISLNWFPCLHSIRSIA